MIPDVLASMRPRRARLGCTADDGGTFTDLWGLQ